MAAVPEVQTGNRSRRAIYRELLATVGLFAIPSFLRAAFFLAHTGEQLFDPAHADWHFANTAVEEGLLLVLLWHVIRLNGEGLANFTKTLKPTDIAHALGLTFVAIMLGWCAQLLLIIAHLPSQPESMMIFAVELSPFYLAFVLLNPFCEEFLVRGFLQKRLQQAAWKPAAVVAASVTVQTAYHVYQGLLLVAAVALMSLLFALYYQKTARLWPVVMAHMLLDVLAMLQLSRK